MSKPSSKSTNSTSATLAEVKKTVTAPIGESRPRPVGPNGLLSNPPVKKPQSAGY